MIVSKGIKNAKDVNDFVYAAAQSGVEFFKKDSTYKEWLKEHRESMKTMRKYRVHALNLIHLFGKNRVNRKKLTVNQNKNFEELIKRFPGKTMHDIVAICDYRLDDLKELGRVREMKTKLAYSRKQPLSYPFREKADKIQITGRQIREVWEPIIGRDRDTEIPEELEGWCRDVPTCDIAPFDTHWEKALKKISPWKAAGPDGIPAYYWKVLRSPRESLKRLAQEIYLGETVPRIWFCTGRVVSIPKGGDLNDPNNYRPITCLNTAYKIVTGTVTNALTEGCNMNDILPPEQRALKAGEFTDMVTRAAIFIVARVQPQTS
jgi:hypothetical protein